MLLDHCLLLGEPQTYESATYGNRSSGKLPTTLVSQSMTLKPGIEVGFTVLQLSE
jgi:hypothetical protein